MTINHLYGFNDTIFSSCLQFLNGNKCFSQRYGWAFVPVICFCRDGGPTGNRFKLNTAFPIMPLDVIF